MRAKLPGPYKQALYDHYYNRFFISKSKIEPGRAKHAHPLSAKGAWEKEYAGRARANRKEERSFLKTETGSEWKRIHGERPAYPYSKPGVKPIKHKN